jgi:hypothetical protein
LPAKGSDLSLSATAPCSSRCGYPLLPSLHSTDSQLRPPLLDCRSVGVSTAGLTFPPLCAAAALGEGPSSNVQLRASRDSCVALFARTLTQPGTLAPTGAVAEADTAHGTSHEADAVPVAKPIPVATSPPRMGHATTRHTPANRRSGMPPTDGFGRTAASCWCSARCVRHVGGARMAARLTDQLATNAASLLSNEPAVERLVSRETGCPSHRRVGEVGTVG